MVQREILVPEDVANLMVPGKQPVSAYFTFCDFYDEAVDYS